MGQQRLNLESMKIKNITFKNDKATVSDACVGDGYRKVTHGSLPDIDSDFDAERRNEVKAYLEHRYNKAGVHRVFSAGTFTTLKVKSAINDIARTHKVPISTTRYLTKILDDDKLTWTGLMKMAFTDKRIRSFINKYPDVFEEILPVMGQARAAGIHASAFIITPEYVKGEKVDCYDLLPIRKMGDMLVSEISGNDIDAIGILKNDVLGIKELTRLSDTLNLIEKEYGVKYTILQIASQYLDDPKVFETLKQGHTQGVFQLSSDGITKYIKGMKPDCINDLIASVALFRPGTLKTGAAEAYVKAKLGEIEPTYLWGTYEILKDTFGQITYQEQVANLARQIGGLSLGEGVNLVKALSKKKIEKVRKFKEKFFKGAEQNHCPKEAAERIWQATEDASSYLFNQSHATAYGLTAYVGAWLKTHYPMPFYSVILRDQDEKTMPILMNEIKNMSGIELLQPDINISGLDFMPDYKAKKIYWSLSRIKFVGAASVKYIVKERERFGDFVDLEEFIHRIFRNKLVKFKNWDDPADGVELDTEKNPVNARQIRHLIMSGAFDNCNNVKSICERHGLLMQAANILGFELPENEIPQDMVDKHYFWSLAQIRLSGMGEVDYRRIWDNIEHPKHLKQSTFVKFEELSQRVMPYYKGVTCAMVTDVVDKTYKSSKDGSTKHFGKVLLQQNNSTTTMLIWDNAWSEFKSLLVGKKDIIVAMSVNIKWSDHNKTHELQLQKGSFFKVVQ